MLGLDLVDLYKKQAWCACKYNAFHYLHKHSYQLNCVLTISLYLPAFLGQFPCPDQILVSVVTDSHFALTFLF